MVDVRKQVFLQLHLVITSGVAKVGIGRAQAQPILAGAQST